jgi:hypothetical protein
MRRCAQQLAQDELEAAIKAVIDQLRRTAGPSTIVKKSELVSARRARPWPPGRQLTTRQQTALLRGRLNRWPSAAEARAAQALRAAREPGGAHGSRLAGAAAVGRSLWCARRRLARGVTRLAACVHKLCMCVSCPPQASALRFAAASPALARVGRSGAERRPPAAGNGWLLKQPSHLQSRWQPQYP